MNFQQKRRISLLAIAISWAGSLMFFWSAAYIFKLRLGWFAIFPIFLALYISVSSRTAIKRLLVAAFGASFVVTFKYSLFVVLGFGSALYTARFAQSLSSLTEIAFIIYGLALGTNGVVRLLAQFGFVHFTKSGLNSQNIDP
jgi:hypothetical protein